MLELTTTKMINKTRRKPQKDAKDLAVIQLIVFLMHYL